MLPVVIWVGLSFCAAYYGRFRRFGFVGWFILSLLISPFMALLILFITAPKSPVPVVEIQERSESRAR